MSRLKDSFSGFEFKNASFLSSKRAKTGEEMESYGPHVKRLPKSIVPEYLTLTKYQKFCWKVMGPFVERKDIENEQLERNLLQAHMKMRVEEYIAYVWMSTFLAAIGGVIAAIILGLILSPILGPLTYLIAGATLFLTPIGTYFGLRYAPASKASSRGKKIDDKLADAMSFIASMASANINIDMIFKELAKQPLYGEVCEEAKWIHGILRY